jgi:hypothetical protein
MYLPSFLILCFLLAGPALRGKDIREGKVMKASGGKLVLVDNEGKNEHSFEVASDSVITLDGKTCKLDDLPQSSWAKVTTEQRGEKTYATKIEAQKSKNPHP